jgi:hypothetical protein
MSQIERRKADRMTKASAGQESSVRASGPVWTNPQQDLNLRAKACDVWTRKDGRKAGDAKADIVAAGGNISRHFCECRTMVAAILAE